MAATYQTFPFLRGMPELLLRKLGHFLEFAALGFFLCWLLRLGGQRKIRRAGLVRRHSFRL